MGQDCQNPAAYAITISYLGRPALTINLCKLHVLDTWSRAQETSLLEFGRSGHVKSVAVRKL